MCSPFNGLVLCRTRLVPDVIHSILPRTDLARPATLSISIWKRYFISVWAQEYEETGAHRAHFTCSECCFIIVVRCTEFAVNIPVLRWWMMSLVISRKDYTSSSSSTGQATWCKWSISVPSVPGHVSIECTQCVGSSQLFIHSWSFQYNSVIIQPIPLNIATINQSWDGQKWCISTRRASPSYATETANCSFKPNEFNE